MRNMRAIAKLRAGEGGVYVIGFFYSVVPQGAARIRTQVSAAHRREDLEFAIRAFADVKKELSL